MQKTCALFLASALLALAQNAGRITGKIEDPSGAAVPAATVVLSLPGSQEPAYVAQTSEQGYFNMTGIRPGNYDLTVRSAGFQAWMASDIKIDAGRELSMPAVRLEVGSVTETVNVTAQATGVQTSNVEVSNTVSALQVRDLPTLDRQMITLINTQAGVTTGRGTTTVNGLRTSAVSVSIDGIQVQDQMFRRNSLQFMPNRQTADQVAEFTLTTSNQNATVGGGAAQVIMVTPSGSNEYHGNLLWNNRNDNFSANSWFNNQQRLPNPPLNRNQFGGYLGGKIIRDKLLFYGGFERLDLRTQTDQNRRVLTGPARQGVYTYRDTAGQVRQVNVLQAVGLRGVDSVVSGLLSRVPGPEFINNFEVGDSIPGLSRNTGGYSFLIRRNRTRNNYTGKLDYLLSTKHVISGSYLYNTEFIDRPDAQHDSATRTNGYDRIPAVFNDNFARLASVGWRWNPSARFTNEVRGGVNQAPGYFNVRNPTTNYQVLSPLFSNPDSNYLDNGRDVNTWNIADNASYTTGKHNFQFGFNLMKVDIRSYNYLGIQPQYTMGVGAGNRGLTGTELPGASSQDITGANELLATLGGYITRFDQVFNIRDRSSGFVNNQAEVRNYRFQQMAFYLQDNWKATSRLNLTLGLRWEPFWPFNERDGLYLMPVVQNGNVIETLMGNATLDFAGGSTGRPYYGKDWMNFSPNIGLAWDVFGDGKTSFRAGYMVAYFNDNIIAAFDNNLTTNRGLRSTVARTGLSATFGGGAPTVPVPAFRVPTNFANNYALDRTSAAGIPDANMATPYMQQWSAGIQRDIKGTVVEIRYVANKGTKLYRGLDFNQIDIRANGFLDDFITARRNGFLAQQATRTFNPNYDAAIPGSQPLRFLPGLPASGGLNNAAYRNLLQQGQVADYANNLQVDGLNGPYSFYRNPLLQGANVMSNFGNSSYHSLQVDVSRRFRNGLQFQGNYVYGKVLTDIGHEDNNNFDPLLDNNNARIERARAPWDLTHAFKANGVWQIPGGKRFANKFLRQIFDGWAVGGFLTWQSGGPFSVLSRRATINRTGARSNQNTATSTLTKGELDDLFQFRMTPNGPFFVAESAKNPLDGRAAAPDGQAPFGGQTFFHPGPGDIGALQRRMFSGPWTFNLDASALKRFQIREGHSLEFRAEAFNATNTPSWLVGDQLIDSTQFGRITTMQYDRRLMQFGLTYRF